MSVRRSLAMRRLSGIAGRSKKSPKFGASWRRIEPEDLKPTAVKSPDLRAKDFAYGCPCRVPPPSRRLRAAGEGSPDQRTSAKDPHDRPFLATIGGSTRADVADC